ncbi:MAG TPA: efflux transporter outer membrane subunit [Acidobacteriota bacterium]|nr:efflux transporter outer membrane subunit [Acidobacteriota bacterium]
MKRVNMILILVGLASFLQGCGGAPAYVRPELPVPSEWKDRPVEEGAPIDPQAADMRWDEFFVDPRLRSVIELALVNNRDLRVAALTVDKVRAMYRIREAEHYPVIAASASADAYRVPENMSGDGEARTVAQYTVGLGAASWEIDFFGRIGSLKSRALEEYLATEQAGAAVRLSIISAVADTYLSLAAKREHLALARATFDTQNEFYELTIKTHDLGMASELEVRQAQSQMEAAWVDIARFSGQVALSENALNLLVGAPVIRELTAGNLNDIAAMSGIGEGLSSEVLLRRPDILAAEHRLRAANANVGAARAAFFPRISLTAAIGIVSSDLADLFKSSAGTWNFAPQVTYPVFDAGSRRAGYTIAKADRNIAVAEYEKTIQTAFREVNDELSLRTTLITQEEAQSALAATLAKALQLSEARYKGGIDSYLPVLVSQRSLYAAQQQLLAVRLERLRNHVNLYRVLAGSAAIHGVAAPLTRMYK